VSSEVKRYDAVHLRYEDSNIRYGEGCEVEVVTASDHEREVQRAIAAGIRMQDKCAALEAECERLRSQVSALQSDANSWQSGYDKGREDGAKAAEGWKAQHARDSAELRKLCAERDALRAENERLNAQFNECARLFVDATEQACKAQRERDELRAELEAARKQEPVASVVSCYVPSGKRVALNTEYQNLPVGTQLYTLPPAIRSKPCHSEGDDDHGND